MPKPSRETGHPAAAQLTEKLVRARTTIYSGAERRLSSESAQIFGKMLLESFPNQQIQLDPTTMSGRESNNNTPSVIGMTDPGPKQGFVGHGRLCGVTGLEIFV